MFQRGTALSQMVQQCWPEDDGEAKASLLMSFLCPLSEEKAIKMIGEFDGGCNNFKGIIIKYLEC